MQAEGRRWEAGGRRQAARATDTQDQGDSSACRAIEAGSKRFAGAFDHAATNEKAVFAQLRVLHPALVLVKIVGFGAQGLGDRRMGGGQRPNELR